MLLPLDRKPQHSFTLTPVRLTAKNLLLMGVPWLGIYDNDQVVTTQTPSVNFLVHAEDLGKNVVDAALPELRSLAPLASISRVSSVPSYSSYSVPRQLWSLIIKTIALTLVR